MKIFVLILATIKIFMIFCQILHLLYYFFMDSSLFSLFFFFYKQILDCLTDACCACTFPLLPSEETTNVGTKICLRDEVYARDVRPLVEGCTCYACCHHTRAYLHHLVVVHEILGQALLDVHNWHHSKEWFNVIRQQMVLGTYEEYAMKFRVSYQSGV